MTRPLVLCHAVWLEVFRRRDFYVLLILMTAMFAWLLSADLFGSSAASRYVLDVGLLYAWGGSLILAVTAAARQLPRDEEIGAVFMMLAKPVTRWDMVFGKWLGTWSVSVGATVALYLAVLAVSALRGRMPDAVSVCQALLLHGCALGVVSALALAISTRMSFGAASTTAFVLLAADYAVVPKIPELIGGETGLRADLLLLLYKGLPHLEVFDLRRRLIHGWGAAPASAILISVAYGVAVTGALLALAWLGYRKKRFPRQGG
ncbi:MAG: ABC transporter permease [Lentisphaerae bacterium]|nr:ABC transporter permease [Lentisphaerota bacterium]